LRRSYVINPSVESSSVLATKIIRAHGNPSPPPRSARPDIADLDYRGSTTPPRPPLPLPGQEQSFLSGHPSSLTSGSREMQSGLLSLAPLTPSITSPSTDSPRALPSHLPPVINHPSVDDPLSPSPRYPPAYNQLLHSSSPSLPMIVSEQLKEDKTLEKNQEVTYRTASGGETGGDATLSLEQPSPGSSSSLVLFSDDGSTEAQKEAMTCRRTIDDHRKDSSNNRKEEDEEAIKEGYLSDSEASRSEGKVTKQSTRDTRSANRQLRSLSPTSADLLTHLLSSPPKSVPLPTLDVTRNDLSAIIERTTSPQHASRFPLPPKTPTPNSPIRLTSHVRFSSPTRPRGSQSPAKTRLQSVALDDPQRTPARRIFIKEAVAQGHISPQKEASFNGRIPVLNIPPTDSPARRVNVEEASASKQGPRFEGSTQGTSPAKRRTTDSPVASGKNEVYGSQTIPDSTSKSRIAGSSSTSAMSRPRPLPFPIMASVTTTSQSTPEPKSIKGDYLRVSSPAKSDSPTTSSPTKSTLRQTTSRIPRSIKPYARPTVQANRQDKSTSTPFSLKMRAMVRFNIDPLTSFALRTFPAKPGQGANEKWKQF